MYKTFLWMLSFLLIGIVPSLSRAQISVPTQTPAVQADEKEDEGDAPFKPYWENEISLGSTNQQGGQATQLFGFTGTYNFDDAGDFLSAGLNGTRQKIEGVFSKTGTLTVSGGLGLGDLSPSLSFGVGTGDSALHQLNAGLGLALRASDKLNLNLSLGANAGNHQGDVTSYLQGIFAAKPVILALINASAPVTAQIDTASLDGSLGASYTLSEGWSLSLILGYAYAETYRIQDIKTPSIKSDVNDADQTATATLGLDVTLFKGFDLDLEPQIGREYQPAGTVYSYQTGGLVQNREATAQNFVGGTVTVNYRFE